MTADFWRENGLRHLTPRGLENPEGWDIWSFLPKLTVGKVIEIGCGAGRLCQAFDPARYLGVDINPAAVEMARRKHPRYRFEVYDGQGGDTALLYTVLLHIPDDDLAAFIAGINARRVVVAEIMGRKWARPGGPPPAFNRDPEDYVAAFAAAGFTCIEQRVKPYRHYAKGEITFLVFER